jgi:hypothetical protein
VRVTARAIVHILSARVRPQMYCPSCHSLLLVDEYGGMEIKLVGRRPCPVHVAACELQAALMPAARTVRR